MGAAIRRREKSTRRGVGAFPPTLRASLRRGANSSLSNLLPLPAQHTTGSILRNLAGAQDMRQRPLGGLI